MRQWFDTRQHLTISLELDAIGQWGLLRTFDESVMSLPGGLFLGSLENSLSQEIEAAPAIHLPLEEFQTMHLALGLAVAPLQGETGFHGIVVFFQAVGKTLELAQYLRR